ncbi:MAG: hypothetical protein ACR2MO_12790 [Acidimicrobiales bacterium]
MTAAGRVTPHLVATAATVLHLASLVGAGALLLWLNRNQWFFGDEWDFLASRRSGFGRTLFAPHNEHWSTIPILVYRVLYGVFGLRSYVPYVAVLILVHLAGVHLVWRLMRRAGVAPLVATALASVFAVLGAGSENLLWAFQIGFVGSLTLGLLHLLLVDHDGPFDRRDRQAWAVAVAALLFSGMSVTMVIVSGLVVLLRRGPKDALKTVALPGAVYLLWLVAIGYEGLGRDGGGVEAVLKLPAYLWTGLTSALERSSGIPGAGAVLVLVVLASLFRVGPVVSRPAGLSVGMAAGAACLFVVTGMGRSISDIGAQQATAGRYTYAAVALLLPALGLLLSELAGRRPARQATLCAALILPLVHNLDLLRAASHAEADREQTVRRQISAATALIESGAPLVGMGWALDHAQPEPLYSSDLTLAALQQLRREGTLPADVPVGERDQLAAAAALQVAVTDTEPTTGGPLPVLSGAGSTVDAAGCAALGASAAADLVFDDPGSVILRSSAGGAMTVVVHSSTETAATGPARTIALRADSTQWLEVSLATVFTISAPAAGPMAVCGVRAPTEPAQG